MVGNPARGQLSREIYFSLFRFPPENHGRVRRVRLSHPASARSYSFSTHRLNLVHTPGIPPAFREGVDLFMPSTAKGVSPEIIRSRKSRTEGVHITESQPAQGQ